MGGCVLANRMLLERQAVGSKESLAAKERKACEGPLPSPTSFMTLILIFAAIVKDHPISSSVFFKGVCVWGGGCA